MLGSVRPQCTLADARTPGKFYFARDSNNDSSNNNMFTPVQASSAQPSHSLALSFDVLNLILSFTPVKAFSTIARLHSNYPPLIRHALQVLHLSLEVG